MIVDLIVDSGCLSYESLTKKSSSHCMSLSGCIMSLDTGELVCALFFESPQSFVFATVAFALAISGNRNVSHDAHNIRSPWHNFTDESFLRSGHNPSGLPWHNTILHVHAVWNMKPCDNVTADMCTYKTLQILSKVNQNSILTSTFDTFIQSQNLFTFQQRISM